MTLTWTSATSDSTPDFELTGITGLELGDVLRLTIDSTDYDVTIDGTNLADLLFDFATGPFANGSYTATAYHRRGGSVLKTSNTENVTISAAAWAPTDIAGLLGWWDASDTATFSLTRAGSLAAPTNGSTVGRWNDKSGNGANMLAQADSSVRPTWVSATNGIRWTKASSQRNLAAAIAASGTEMTVICVAKTSASDDDYIRLFTTTFTETGADGGDTGLLYTELVSPDFTVSRAGSTSASKSYTEGTKQVFISEFNGTTHRALVDYTAGTSQSSSGSFTFQYFAVGGHPPVAVLFDGEIYEVILVAGVLSAGELTSLAAYTLAKWGV